LSKSLNYIQNFHSTSIGKIILKNLTKLETESLQSLDHQSILEIKFKNVYFNLIYEHRVQMVNFYNYSLKNREQF